MPFQLTADQMTALFGSNWQSLTKGNIDQADPSSIVGQALAAHGAIGAWRTAYLTLLEYASGTEYTITQPDSKLEAKLVPGAGVDPSAWLWLQGAADANAGRGYFAGVIRDYTAAQYKARIGKTLDPSDIYKASAGVAEGVFSELLPADLGALPMSPGTVPDISTIASRDVGAIANLIFGGDFTPWSGTLLFPYLGVGGIFEELVLKSQVNKFVGENLPIYAPDQKDTYDLVSIL